MAGPSPWTDELIEELKRLWALGYSSRDIARELGHAWSRSSIIGKASRLGLARRRGEQPRSYRKTDPRVRKKVERPVFVAPPPPPPPPPPPKPQPQPLKIFDLQEHHCRWPLGEFYERAQFFCGGARCGKGPYCAEHTALAWRAA